jgi:hypothetical protein
MDVKNDILWRVYLSFLLIVAVAIAIMGKAVYIQQVQGAYWRSLSDSIHQRIESIEAERGTIFTEDGQMLSTSVPRFDIYWDTRITPLRENSGKLFREKVDSLADALATLFKDLSAGEYKLMLQQAYQQKEGFFLLKKKISFREYEQLRTFPLVNLGRYTSGIIPFQKNSVPSDSPATVIRWDWKILMTPSYRGNQESNWCASLQAALKCLLKMINIWLNRKQDVILLAPLMYLSKASQRRR